MNKFLASGPGQLLHAALALLLIGGGAAIVADASPAGLMLLVASTLLALLCGILGIGSAIAEFPRQAALAAIAAPFLLFVHNLACYLAMGTDWTGYTFVALGVVVMTLGVFGRARESGRMAVKASGHGPA